MRKPARDRLTDYVFGILCFAFGRRPKWAQQFCTKHEIPNTKHYPEMAWNSHALLYVQYRFAVAGEMSSAAAVSSMVSPAK